MNEFSLINLSYGQHESFLFYFSYYNRKGPDKNNIQIPVQLDHHHPFRFVLWPREWKMANKTSTKHCLGGEVRGTRRKTKLENRPRHTAHTKGDRVGADWSATRRWHRISRVKFIFKYGIWGSSSCYIQCTLHTTSRLNSLISRLKPSQLL